jgi:hypothetical protein
MNIRRTADTIHVSEITRVKDTEGRRIFEKKASCRWNTVSTKFSLKLRLTGLWRRYLATKVNRNTLLVSVSCVMLTACGRILWKALLHITLTVSSNFVITLTFNDSKHKRRACHQSGRYLELHWRRVLFVHSKVSEVYQPGVHNSRATVCHGVYIKYGVVQ